MNSVRDLALVDCALHGRKLILFEFWGAVVLGLGLAFLFFGNWHVSPFWIVAGFCAIGLSLNYLPLALYASLGGTAEEKARAKMIADSRKVGPLAALSILLVVPGIIFTLAAIQVIWALGRGR